MLLMLASSLFLSFASADIAIKVSSGEVSFDFRVTQSEVQFRSKNQDIRQPVNSCSFKIFDHLANKIKYNLRKDRPYTKKVNKNFYQVLLGKQKLYVPPLSKSGITLAKMDGDIRYALAEESVLCSGRESFVKNLAKKKPQRSLANSEDKRDCSASSDQGVLQNYSSCREQLCEGKGFKSFFLIPDSYHRLTRKESYKENEIYKRLEQLREKKTYMDKDLDAKIVEDFKSKKPVFSKEDLEFALDYALVESIGAFLIGSWSYVDERVVFSVNTEKLEKAALPLSKANQEMFKVHVVQATKNYDNINPYSNYQHLYEDKNKNSDAYFNFHYPNLSKIEAVKELIKDFKKNYKDIESSSFGKYISKVIPFEHIQSAEIVNEIESGKDVSELALRELIQKATDIRFQVALFKSASSINKNNMDFKDIRQRLTDAKHVLRTLEKKKEDDEKTNADEVEFEKKCRTDYRLTSNNLPTDLQLKNIEGEIVKVKNSIQKKWAVQYSKETQSKVNKYTEEVSFLLPLSKKEYYESVKNKIRREYEHITRQLEKEKEILKNLNVLKGIFLIQEYANGFKGSEEDTEKESDSKKYEDNLCRVKGLYDLNDANYTLLGKIRMSFTGVHEPDLGRGVIAHEIGHGLYRALYADDIKVEDKAKHHELGECLALMHPEKELGFYRDEDFSDYVAGSVESTNLACLFYIDNDCLSSRLVENQDQADVHSSRFFRLLHIESLQRKSLPLECKKVLEIQKTPRDFQMCQRKFGL